MNNGLKVNPKCKAANEKMAIDSFAVPRFLCKFWAYMMYCFNIFWCNDIKGSTKLLYPQSFRREICRFQTSIKHAIVFIQIFIDTSRFKKNDTTTKS